MPGSPVVRLADLSAWQIESDDLTESTDVRQAYLGVFPHPQPHSSFGAVLPRDCRACRAPLKRQDHLCAIHMNRLYFTHVVPRGIAMRTNVVLDEALVEQAKVLTGIKTTRGVIDEALHVLIQLREQSQVRDLRGRLRWEGDLAALREGPANAYEVTMNRPTPDAAG